VSSLSDRELIGDDDETDGVLGFIDDGLDEGEDEDEDEDGTFAEYEKEIRVRAVNRFESARRKGGIDTQKALVRQLEVSPWLQLKLLRFTEI
jgi:hypothetical protein